MFVVVQSLSHVQLFVTPWTVARQASLSITNSWSLLKLMSIELVMSSNHLILCHPLLLLPSIFPSIRLFTNESALFIRWPKYWSSALVSISSSSEYSGLISFRMCILFFMTIFHKFLKLSFCSSEQFQVSCLEVCWFVLNLVCCSTPLLIFLINIFFNSKISVFSLNFLYLVNILTLFMHCSLNSLSIFNIYYFGFPIE